ncbi:MAG: hypothetical protein J5J06_05495 [Phycisphaerae bacterium]|nr:hypothetical protein [Phycisphaerae bacterium]
MRLNTAPGLKVLVYDPLLGKSRSLTVYGAEVESLAREVEAFLAHRYRTTRLDDRRHKRR